MRIVSKRFATICGKHLNIGFIKAREKINALRNYYRSLVPKRISARVNHPLYYHYRTMQHVEMISNLGYGHRLEKYIRLGICCFYPGKIIDETLTILQVVKTTQKITFNFKENLIKEVEDLKALYGDHFDNEMIQIYDKKVPKPEPEDPEAVKKSIENLKTDLSNLKKLVRSQETKISATQAVVKRQSQLLTKQSKATEILAKKSMGQENQLKAKDKEIKDLIGRVTQLEKLISFGSSEKDVKPKRKKTENEQLDEKISKRKKREKC